MLSFCLATDSTVLGYRTLEHCEANLQEALINLVSVYKSICGDDFNCDGDYYCS